MSLPTYAGPYALPGALYANPAFALSPVIGQDDFFSYKTIGVADRTYYSVTDTLFHAEASKTVRPHNIAYRDRTPISGGNFGEEVLFQVGKEGLTIINKIQLAVTLPSFVTQNTVGATGDMISKYKDWIALYLLGGFQRGPGVIRVLYSNNTIRTMDADSIHFKKLLGLPQNSTQEQCYQATAGADAESGYGLGGARGSQVVRQAVNIFYEIDMPFARARNFGSMLIASALPDTFEIRFTIPSFLDLIESDVTTADDAGWLAYCAAITAAQGNWALPNPGAAAAVKYDKTGSIVGTISALQPKVFARIQGYNLMKTERAALSSSVYSDKGASHMTFDHEMSVDNFLEKFSTSTLAATQLTSEIAIKTIKNPSTYYIHVLRNSLSLNRPVDSFTITVAPGATLQAAIIASANGLADFISNNDRFSEIYPVGQYALLDEQKLATEQHSDFYYRVKELADRFEMSHNILNYKPVLIVHCLWPLVEEHGLGHLTNINMIQPQVRLVHTAFPFTPQQDPRGLVTPTVQRAGKCASVVYNNFQIPISDASWNAIVAAKPNGVGQLVVDNHSCARNIFRQRRGDNWMNYK